VAVALMFAYGVAHAGPLPTVPSTA
jgi:hypothetical protein